MPHPKKSRLRKPEAAFICNTSQFVTSHMKDMIKTVKPVTLIWKFYAISNRLEDDTY